MRGNLVKSNPQQHIHLILYNLHSSMCAFCDTRALTRAGSDRRCKRHGVGGTDKERLLAGFQWKGYMDKLNIHRNERDLETV